MVSAMLRWLTTPTGLILVAGGAAVAIGIVAEDLAGLTAIGMAVIVGVIARVVVLHNRRLAVLTSELANSNDAHVERQRALAAEIDQRARAAEIDQRTSALADKLEAIDARVASLEQAVGEQHTASAAAEGERTDIRTALASVADDARAARSELHEQVVTIRDRITSAIERERSVRSLSIARMTAPADAPERVLLLMTLHRSGSTRLFDIFRTHPGTDIAPTVDVWDRLGLRGRRYPVAFSDLPTSWRAIEIEHARGATIPELPVADRPFEGPRWALEKAHPQFCDFDAEAFAAHVDALRADGVEVEVAYGVRAPLDAMWSMVAFQKRQPSWYAFLGSADIPEWVRRSLDTMAEMHDRIPGVVLDYQDLPGGLPVRSLGARLAPAWTDEDLDAWASFADTATSPDRPVQAGTGFLGGSAEREEGGPDGAWTDLDEVIAAADEAYRRLRG